MYRQRIHITAKTVDAWNECLRLADEYNKLAAARGWTQGALWAHTVGSGSEIIAEFDYADLAAFQRENDEVIRDKDAVQLFRKFDEVTDGPGDSELLETAPMIG